MAQFLARCAALPNAFFEFTISKKSVKLNREKKVTGPAKKAKFTYLYHT
jgi:hypothetical protein